MTASTIREEADAHRRAAEAAEEATHWQEAASAYEQCLSLVTQDPDGAGQDEAALLTHLGRCYWNLSEARTAWRTLRRAITLYRDRADAAGQAAATVEILRIWGPPERQKMMAEEALHGLGDSEPHLRAILLLRLRWFDEDHKVKFGQAMALAEQHGFDDVLALRTLESAWIALETGRIEEAKALFDQAHEALARERVYDEAAGTLRGAGFNLLELGELDDGYAAAQRCFEYATSVNLHFSAQLAVMDMAGVAFARGEFDRCEEVLALAPTNFDFRGDLYRMWMAERRGDIDSALQLMVDPARGGNTPTAVGQIHAAAAGILYRAGREDAAAQALRTWDEVPRNDSSPYWAEAPAALECLLALGSDELVRKVYDALVGGDRRMKLPVRYSTLQGRALAPLRGGVCALLGLRDEAERHYREGLAWCEAQRCIDDAERCRRGLAALA